VVEPSLKYNTKNFLEGRIGSLHPSLQQSLAQTGTIEVSQPQLPFNQGRLKACGGKKHFYLFPRGG
jgi:hypothetical protein